MLALIEAGADIDATTESSGWPSAEGLELTALQQAAVHGHQHCVCTLLLAGAALPTSLPGVADLESAEQAHALIQETAECLGLMSAPAAAGDSERAGAAAAAATAGAALDDALRGEVCCPITHEVMEDPVIAADGTTYERAAIESECCGEPAVAGVAGCLVFVRFAA